jgi:hypothetical protein
VFLGRPGLPCLAAIYLHIPQLGTRRVPVILTIRRWGSSLPGREALPATTLVRQAWGWCRNE